MKKFTLKAITLATASICGSVAFAGNITSPLLDTNATAYAVESLLPAGTTAIVLPAITYTMGVARTPAQDFTIIYKPSAGATFASCPAAGTFTQGGTGTVVVSSKRSSTTECAYEVDVTVASDVTKTLTLNGLSFATHTLATAGNTASVVVGLWDLGETARIDNNGDITRRVASSGNALRLTAAADTATTTDVNHPSGPLFGFVAANDDSASTAKATFVVNNNSGATTFKKPDGTTNWDFRSDGTAIAVTVTGNFSGLATNGVTAVVPTGTNPVVTATAAGSTATFTLQPTNVFGGTSNTDVTVGFLSSQTLSLGTSRTFGVAAVGDVVVGADVALAGNSGWWVWKANASQLMTPYFTTNSLFLSRFFFLSESATPVLYSADCYSESGNAITYGAGRTGTLSANGQTAVNASSICTFAGNSRGSIIFTINAPIEKIKGSYQAVDPVSLNNSVTPLVRRYGTGNTTE